MVNLITKKFNISFYELEDDRFLLEFISKALDKWACENQVILDFLRPGKPTEFSKKRDLVFGDGLLLVNDANQHIASLANGTT